MKKSDLISFRGSAIVWKEVRALFMQRFQESSAEKPRLIPFMKGIGNYLEEGSSVVYETELHIIYEKGQGCPRKGGIIPEKFKGRT